MTKLLKFETISVEAAAEALNHLARPRFVKNETRRRTPPRDESLAEATLHWLASMPPHLAPQKLAQQFPRVANRICELWKRPSRCDVYLYELLIDHRIDRAGFPAQVMKELGTLAAYYAELYPKRQSAWNHLHAR